MKTATASHRKIAREEIGYWSEVCRAHHRDPQLKRAGGGGQDVPFEQAFANLAHAYLKDRAPQLLDYELGFQLLEKSQDNDKAVGVFGFKVGPQWLYAPQFFLNGELKGHELLYLKDSDTFVPLQENWINYILNRKPDVLGEEVNTNLSHLGVERPDIQQFRQSPGKFASAQEPWLQRGLPGLMYATGYQRLPKYEMAVPRLVKESADAAMLMLRWIDCSPTLGRQIVECYGPQVVRDAIKTAQTRNTLVPTEVARTYPDILTGSIFQEKTAAHHASEQRWAMGQKLRIYKSASEAQSELGQADQEALLRRGFLVKDARDDSEISRLFVPPRVFVKRAEDETGSERKDTHNPHVAKIQEPITLQNPDETNIYEVLVRPGGLEDCIVLHNPMGGRGTSSSCVVIKKTDPRSWIVEHPGNLYTLSKFSRADYDAWFNALPEGGSMEQGSVYVLIGPRGNGTLPFEIDKSMPAKEGEKCYQVYWRSSYDKRPDHLPPVANRTSARSELGYHHSDKIISIGASRGTNATSRGGVLYFPDGWKVLKLKAAAEDSGCCSVDGTQSSDPSPIRPGDPVDIQLGIISKSAELKVWCDGTEVILGQARMNKQAALFSLMQDYGLREKAAAEALQLAEAASARRAPGIKFRIKYAQPYDLIQSAPGAPPYRPAQQEMTTDPYMGSGLPTQMGGVYEEPVPGMQADPRGRMPMSGPPQPDPDAMNRVQQAAQSGQREVLDTSMLSNLLKGSRRETLIDRYLGDLVKGLDRMGRLLFNFYWHRDLFEEEFGSQDLATLEDALSNSFETTGDLVLELKQKTVEPYPNAGGDTDLEAAANN